MFRLRLSPFARALRRLRWTETEARLVLDAATQAGVSLPEFARRHRIDAQRLITWARRLARTTPRPPPLTFLEVGLPPVASAEASPRYEIQLASGAILRVEGRVDAATVRTLLAVLHGAPTC